MRVLVTGAAGYIGSVVCEQLLEAGHAVVGIDNLEQGHRQAVSTGAHFIQADLSHIEQMEEVFRLHPVEAVMHLAAQSIVSESMTDPAKCFRGNVVCGLNLLETMLRHGVGKLVFSSTAAVYGEPAEVPIKEGAVEKPVNPYGESKLAFERALHWYEAAYGLKFISLRYFNAAGASLRFGEDHSPETHLIPNIIRVALGREPRIPVFGTDYPTEDGTCIRDYIHVLDIARAHVLSIDHLENDGASATFNLGNSRGHSVLGVIETAREIAGAAIPVAVLPRRRGDPAVLIADSDLAESELGWRAENSDLRSIVSSAWQWAKRHPRGYE